MPSRLAGLFRRRVRAAGTDVCGFRTRSFLRHPRERTPAHFEFELRADRSLTWRTPHGLSLPNPRVLESAALVEAKRPLLKPPTRANCAGTRGACRIWYSSR